MNIHKRKSNIVDMYYNPWITPTSRFEAFHLASVRDHGRNEHSPAPDEKTSPVSMRIFDLHNKMNVLLYSGGKESFLTACILDHYAIPYQKLYIEEIGAIRDSERHSIYGEISKKIKDSCHHVKQSRIINRYISSNRFGRNFPITYYYILDTLDSFGDVNVLVGAEWLSDKFLHNQIKFEHSDVLYRDINEDGDILGNVYSIVNSILEFDVYRLVTNYLGYDDRWSYYDHSKKEERIGYFKRMNNLINDIENSPLREDVLSELEFIVPQVRLMSPIYYDFRKDISIFIENVNKYGLS